MRKLIILTFLLSMFALPAALRAEEANITYITSARVNFREEANIDSNVISILPEGYELSMIHYDPSGWSRVAADSAEGYVNSEFIIKSNSQALVMELPDIQPAPPIIEEPEQTEPIRIDPGYEGPAQIDTGQTESIDNRAPSQPDNIIYITSARVNFREQASFDGNVFEVVPAGLALNIVSYDANGWSKVLVNGVEGYINSEFIIRRDTLAVGEDFGILNSRVENVNWSVLKEELPLNTPIEVLDLRSGQRYYILSFSNGLHADVVPLTQHDTDIMLQTFGGRWEWTQRPVWVTVSGRTFAASINGMPHGGGVSTMENNGMNGHICLHFAGSRPHNGNASYERDNQLTVEEAWSARLR